jgi:phytoene dehydrogenase-like protein
MAERFDAVIVGGGHNGLVCALLLRRAGLSVKVLERADVVGGAARTERPFRKLPDMPTSTGAYLLGLVQPELLRILDLDLPLLRRDPHYFLPTLDGRYLLFGSDEAALADQFRRFSSEADYRADRAMQTELAEIREDIAPTWLEEPLSIEETAERFVRAPRRRAFVDLCRGSVGDYLERFAFESDLVKAMYAVTDGFSGLYGSWSTPGTGMNFLIHNMCRLREGGGTWMIVRGGMGTVTQTLAKALREAGGTIETGVEVAKIEHQGGVARAVVTGDGRRIDAGVIVTNCDPFRMVALIGREHLPSEYVQRIDGYARPGSTFKVNLALTGLPRFTCLPENRGQFGPTIHLLPAENPIGELERAFAEVGQGILPRFPSIEWYVHSTVDPSLTDGKHLSSALFVQWVPYRLSQSSWEVEAEPYARHLLEIADRFAPGTSKLVADMHVLTPPAIERHFGITHGHIHHVDNGFGFADRLPYVTPIAGLYSCSAGTHPAGSVIGCAGHNAARRVLRDLGRDR